MLSKLLQKIIEIRSFVLNIEIIPCTMFGLKIGRNVYIGPGTHFDWKFCWLISIGDNCVIAPRVSFIAHDASTKAILNYTKIGRIDIGNNVFIGANSIILPGVTIGDNTIIGAGSVVTRSFPSNSIVSGNPARITSSLDDHINRKKVQFAKSIVIESIPSSKLWKENIKDKLKGINGYTK